MSAPAASASGRQPSSSHEGLATASGQVDTPEDPDPLLGWTVTLLITAVAGFMRLWRLGTPHDILFDETYYAKDAWSLWRHGYGQTWTDEANDAILGGTYGPELMTGDPQMTVHPETAKWLIGAGEQIFGFDPTGWRVASAVVGTLMVLVMIRLVRRVTRSTLLGGVAGVLMCFDGLQFTLSRLALLDIFVAFFLLAAVSCLVADRDWTRARVARLARTATTEQAGSVGGRVPGWGPVRGLWWRPWRLTAGLLMGLAISSKWTALIPLAGFGILVYLWDATARRNLGVRRPWLKSALLDGVPAFGYLVVVAAVVYVVSWTGWLLNAEVYEARLSRNSYGPYWGDYTTTRPVGLADSVLQSLRSLAHYHRDLWGFHSSGLVGATHPYASDPAGWLAMYRPVSVAVESGIEPGAQGCQAAAGSTCIREVVLLGTPVLWWGGIVALLHAVYAWVWERDWRYGTVVVGLCTAWLPFLAYADRPIFSFYAVAVLPFTILAICLLLGRIIGPAVPGRRRVVGTALAGTFVVLVMVHFVWLWPVYTFELLTTSQWLDRLWFKSWV